MKTTNVAEFISDQRQEKYAVNSNKRNILQGRYNR